ncbi:hypothetical protein cand_023500 [Cryptosporidium andersoni]|uniref:Uncharacterized protein n=1 Tax=Cryptosporidium andersoni TaxID=117008 RepID=A0A1J4MSG0_9CRYT|nr:hypothetical protein cand_023500 [Cryptosporidium andersoni]
MIRFPFGYARQLYSRRTGIILNCLHLQRSYFNICIVGSGPSGCYVAKGLIKESRTYNIPIKIDIIDSHNNPYGLIRYGVAPDNTDIKEMMNELDYSLFRKYPDIVKFWGNITVGHDLTLKDIRDLYDVVILAVGGCQDYISLKLHIKANSYNNKLFSEKVGGIFPARDWVLFYNSHPYFKEMLCGNQTNSKYMPLYYNLKFPIEEIETDLDSTSKVEIAQTKGTNLSKYSNQSEITKFIAKSQNYGYSIDDLKKSIITSSNSRNAIIIGNGNVSLDIARLMSFYNYNELKENKYINPHYIRLFDCKLLEYPLFNNIYVIGRRGWVQTSFTTSELRRFIYKSTLNSRYNNIRVMMSKEDFILSQNKSSVVELTSKNINPRRLNKIKDMMYNMVENYLEYKTTGNKDPSKINIIFKYLQSPINIITKDMKLKREGNNLVKVPFISGVGFVHNELIGSPFNQKVTPIYNKKSFLPCQLLIISTGFKPDIRQVYFGSNLYNEEYKDQLNLSVPPVFHSGWMSSNSKGDISSTILQSLELAKQIINYLRTIKPKFNSFQISDKLARKKF